MIFQLSYFKSSKCYTKYASKWGKHSMAMELEKVSFHSKSQRKARLRNAQCTAQLHSAHTLVKQCSKLFKPGFSNMWTMNLQIFKLVLGEGEEPEIKVPTATGSSKKQESSRKTSISALLIILEPLTVWITINCGNSERDGKTGSPDLPLEQSVCRSGSNS